MNAGAQALARVGESLSAIAAKLSPPTTRQAVGLWRTGKTLPTTGYRVALETLYGIPRSVWDPMPVPPREALTASPPARAEASNALEELRLEVQRYERRLVALESDPEGSGRLYVQLLNGKVAALARLARLEADESLIRAEVEKTILDRLRPLLEKHPTVAAEIAAALEAP